MTHNNKTTYQSGMRRNEEINDYFVNIIVTFLLYYLYFWATLFVRKWGCRAIYILLS